MSAHDALHPFFDGELPPAEADAFRIHLGGCEHCQSELHSLMQLEALEDAAPAPHAAMEAPARDLSAPTPAARTPASRPATPGKVLPFRRRVVAFAGAGLALAATMTWAVLSAPRATLVSPAGSVTLALAPKRSLEARLAYSGARTYRPYEVQRSAETSAERVPLATLERLEATGDLHGAAAGYLLRGDWKEAEAMLRKAGLAPDVQNDRAVLALSRGAPEEALVLLDELLERAPEHGPARFNRGLALQALGLPRGAAAAFESATALAEPGWATEAHERAEGLRRDSEALHESWETAWKQGQAMVQGGPALPLAAARAHPGIARLLFYDAVRGAASAARLGELRDLAGTLDGAASSAKSGVERSSVLTAALDRAARRDFRRRGPLAERYRKLVAGALSPEEMKAFLVQLRAAGEDDLLLGALPYASQLSSQSDAQREVYRALAQRSGDEWFIQNADLEAARVAREHADFSRAEALLSTALARCDHAEPPYRCAQLHERLTALLTQEHRLPEAEAHAKAGLALARRGQEWNQETQLLQWLGEIARFRGVLALTRAFLSEAALRHPEHCPIQVSLAETLATLQTLALRPEAARAELARAPRCGSDTAPLSPVGATVLVALSRMQPKPDDAERVRAALAPLRTADASPGTLALADAVEGALRAQSDGAAGEMLWRQALEEAKRASAEDPEAARARTLVHNERVLTAGKALRFDEVLSRLAEASGVAAPERCVLGAAVDDERLVLVVAGADGAVHGAYDGARRTPVEDVAGLVPSALLDALRGCATVGVLARPPLHGRAELLPPELAWSYLGAGGDAPHPHSETPGIPGGLPLVVSDVEPPAALDLPRLKGLGSEVAGLPASRVELRGASATPSRVLRELEEASYAELHAHGLVNPAVSDAALLVLSPENNGRYALSAADVRAARLKHHPIVLLGACRAGQTAFHFYEPWSLPVAFIQAGARAVIASPDDIPDGEANQFLSKVRARIFSGEEPETAVRDERQRILRESSGSWVRRVLVFR